MREASFMDVRRAILLLLVIILGIILAYNYWIMNYMVQSGVGMGMGMHGRMWGYGQLDYRIDLNYIWVLLILIIGLLIFDIVQSTNMKLKCSKCGKDVEDERWKICPVCGTRINRNRG